MKLKGLVWFFTIALTIISLFELSYTWVVRNYEGTVTEKVTRDVKKTSGNLSPESRDSLIEVKVQHVLDSTKDKSIYPLFGTTYQKCKENELNLGLDLQGGISVTMDVSLEGLLKSLSNNSKDPGLINAINTATAEKLKSEENFIDLFTAAYIKQNGANKLSGLFAGPGKDVGITDNDDVVKSKIKKTANGAINQTYKILTKRIDKFGVAQPTINLDENKGIINVELAGIKDPERVRNFLQSSANLQFWEVYNISEIATPLQTADKNLQNYMNGVLATDTAALADTNKLKENVNPFLRVINPMDGQQDPTTGKVVYPSAIGNVLLQDTSTFLSYINNPVVKTAFPANIKFLFGVEEKSEKGNQRFFPLYAIKTMPGSDKAPLEGDGVQSASQQFDQNGRPSISMQMNPIGTNTWARLTGKNVGRPIAIALDNIVYSAPNVNGAIEGGNSEISGNFTIEQAQDLADILTSGRLDAPAKIVAQQVIGPTLGQEAVNGGIKSFFIAFAIIFALMLIYYNTGGWVANMALILNVLFTIGVLIALKFTLTAAGIAGLVLTIGLAVDTNVLIFERIKDELDRGKSYHQAITEGYSKSLPPVIDGHLTSLITAVILFYFGLGPVLGFATTQIIGIIFSMFCGILVSRIITDFWTNKNRHFNYFTKVSKRIFHNANFNFVGFRKIAYIISFFILIGGISTYFVGFHQGVEFKGGRSYTVEFGKNISSSEITKIRDGYQKSINDNVVIKTVGDDKHLNITTSYLIDDANADEQVKLKLFEGLKDFLPAGTNQTTFEKSNIQAYQTIQPSISDDLKRGAVKATLFALLAIFLYIFIRFKDWRYSMGTIFSLLHDVLVTLIVFSFFKNIVPFPLEIDQHFIAAILTVIGFSMNDTVVVFDRVREYSRDMKGATKENIINSAINHTLSRTIMTSVTVFLVLLVLFIFGGEVTRGFAFAMLIGVVTGTYSSIFVGAPVLLEFAKDRPLGAAKAVVKKEKAPEL